MRYAYQHSPSFTILNMYYACCQFNVENSHFLVHLVFHNINEMFALCIAHKCGRLSRNKVTVTFVTIDNQH